MAQGDLVTEICGAKFGAPYASVKATLQSRFGEGSCLENKDIFYIQKSIFGIDFNILTFRFENGKLKEFTFVTLAETKEGALKFEENVIDMLERKKYNVYLTEDRSAYYGGKALSRNNVEHMFHLSVSESGYSDIRYKVMLYFYEAPDIENK